MSQFLTFDDTFVRWLLNYAGRRPIFDVGCGEGHLLRALLSAGNRRALGIESRYVFDEDLVGHVVVTDATETDLLIARGCLLVVARPCHGEWVGRVVDRANSEVLYIGRPSKVEIDLPEGRMGRARRIEAPGIAPCLDDEEVGVWSIRPRYDDYTLSFWLVQDDLQGAFWRQRQDKLGPRGKSWTPECPTLGYWANGMGAGFAVSEKDVILEGPVEVREERELDWTRCPYYLRMAEEAKQWPPPKASGWLSPTGEFFYCHYHQHDTFAYYVLGYEVRELEKMGWARVHADDAARQGFAVRPDWEPFTPAQEKTIRELFPGREP